MSHRKFVEQVRRYYECHKNGLYAYALALTRNRHAAEDVLHGVFCRLLARGRAPRNLKAYLLFALGGYLLAPSVCQQAPTHQRTVYVLQAGSEAAVAAFQKPGQPAPFLSQPVEPVVRIEDVSQQDDKGDWL